MNWCEWSKIALGDGFVSDFGETSLPSLFPWARRSPSVRSKVVECGKSNINLLGESTTNPPKNHHRGGGRGSPFFETNPSHESQG